jgi:F-type H+-transporting ATPase subunit gamma
MPSLKAIRKRITSVKNTQKITRALKLVAASRLRRAQESITAARPYAVSMEQVIADLAARTDRSETHELLQERDGNRVQVLVFTSDRGLAGSFNAQINRRVHDMIREEYEDAEVSLRIVGRKGNEYFKRRRANIVSHDEAPTLGNALSFARELAHRSIEDFTEDRADRILLVYNEFKSAISQTVEVQQLLPVVPAELAAGEAGDFVYEPSKGNVLDHLLPLHVEIQIYRAALESVASFFGAQMSAMDSATRNAGEMIEKYSLQYNRARQAAITKELLEITAGAEALKG